MVRSGVFINYRAVDSRGYGPLLYTCLSDIFGADRVFLDTESIPAGADFVSHLLCRIRQATVVLAVIGADWLTVADAHGRRRIDDPQDWIRRELVEAFAAGVQVVPVLVDDADVPRENQLPNDIVRLGRCQYRRLRHRETLSDVRSLVTDLVTIDPRLAERPTNMATPLVVGRPPLAGDAFQDRPDLSAVLDGTGTTWVIVGDGGTGKTQLAAAAFRAAMRDIDIAIWITADSRANVLSAYANANAAIRVTDDCGDAEQQSSQLLAWLTGTRMRWLIVLDDVADPTELRGLWPAGHHGRVLVTTRRRDAAIFARGRIINVHAFTRAESVGYLTAKLSRVPGMPGTRLNLADRLAEELGDLPLALSHAAATIINDGTSCADYVALLTDGTRFLADVLPHDPAEAGDEYAHAVSGTWSLARERADRLDPMGLASPLTDVIAFLDPNGIPEATLTSQPVCKHLGADVSAALARRALRNLWRLSLIDHDPDDPVRGVRMHALAQRASVERLPSATAAVTIRVAADALMSTWPDIEAGTTLGHVLRANAATLGRRYRRALWLPEPHPILFRFSTSLVTSGLVADALSHALEMTEEAMTHLGSDHPGALLARRHLARARGHAGDPVGAAQAYKALLVGCSRVLGPDHPDTLTARGGFAWWQGKSGAPYDAVAMFTALLPDQQRILGHNHPLTLATRNSLARWQGKVGDLAGAIGIFSALLADELRLFGPDHPDTLTTKNNLAHVRGKAGDPAGAAAEVEQVLAGRMMLLGPDHPRTLTTRAHLARWRGESGDCKAAVAGFAEILAKELSLYGPNHPRVLHTRGSLAHWRGRAGDSAAAAANFEELLGDRRRLLGPNHPDTAGARRELGLWHVQSGR